MPDPSKERMAAARLRDRPARLGMIDAMRRAVAEVVRARQEAGLDPSPDELERAAGGIEATVDRAFSRGWAVEEIALSSGGSEPRRAFPVIGLDPLEDPRDVLRALLSPVPEADPALLARIAALAVPDLRPTPDRVRAAVDPDMGVEYVPDADLAARRASIAEGMESGRLWILLLGTAAPLVPPYPRETHAHRIGPDALVVVRRRGADGSAGAVDNPDGPAIVSPRTLADRYFLDGRPVPRAAWERHPRVTERKPETDGGAAPRLR